MYAALQLGRSSRFQSTIASTNTMGTIIRTNIAARKPDTGPPVGVNSRSAQRDDTTATIIVTKAAATTATPGTPSCQ